MGFLEGLLIFFCLFVMLLLLVGGLVGYFIGRAAGRANLRAQFTELVQSWRQSQQIDEASAQHLLSLLHEEAAEPTTSATALNAPLPQPSAAEATAAASLPAQLTVAAPAAASLPTELVSTEPRFAEPPVDPGVSKPVLADRSSPLFAALLSLGMRRMLLIIGTFLVMISILVLVVFNWNSFLPIVQVSIIAVLTGGFWGLGQWMERRTDLVAAGRNLSAVAALLTPIVAFSLTRPGLLDLDLSLATLFVSSVSALLYTIGAWRLRRLFYSLAASVAMVAVLVSAYWQFDVALRWQPVWSFGLWALALVVAVRLNQSSAASLALGPRILQWAGPPLALLVSLSLFLANPTVTEAVATMTALMLGAGFWFGLAWIDNQPRWLWATAIAVPLTVVIGSVLPDFGLSWINQSLAVLAAGYVGLAALLERRSPAYAKPLLVIAPVLVLMVLSTTFDRWLVLRCYPLLIGAVGLTVVLLEQSRLLVLQPRRTMVGATLLSLAILLLVILVSTLGQANQSFFIALVVSGLVFLVSAAPMTASIGYAPAVCRYMGAGLIAITTTLTVLYNVELRMLALAGALLLYGWQALRSRQSGWALGSLTAGVSLLAFGLHQFGWLETFTQVLLFVTILSILLGISGSWLYKGTFRYWGIPALMWAGLLNGISFVYLLNAVWLMPQVIAPSLAIVMAALMSGAGWIAIGAIWRRWWMGYPAAVLLAMVWILGITGGFIKWYGDTSELAVLALPLSAGYGVMALAWRRWPVFDRPYAHFALGSALLLPLPALASALDSWVQPGLLTDFVNLSLAAGGSAAMLAVGALVYRRWRLFSLSLIDLMFAISGIALWLAPRDELVLGWILLVAAIGVGLGGAGLRRWAAPALRVIGTDSYLIGGLTMLVALTFLWNGGLVSLSWPLLFGAFALALIAVSEQNEFSAVGSVAALSGSLAGWSAMLTDAVAWQATWLVLGLVFIVLAGWAVRRFALGGIWQRPTLWLPLVVGAITLMFAGLELRAFVVALINAGVGLITLTVRERRSEYAYLAGAAFVAASLGQFMVWEVAEMQFYVLPVGVYLLALANSIRYFQRHYQLARLIDASAVVLMLGATFLQAINSSGSAFYVLLVGGESLLVAVYGALLRLRVPFIGGIIGLVVGVLWLAINAAQLLNQWLFLGVIGLLMLLAYVILERQQEYLRQIGRNWAERLQQWR